MGDIHELPRVRVTLDTMRHDIIHAFNAHAEDLKKQVEAAVSNEINNFNMDEEVHKIASTVLKEVVKNVLTSTLSELAYNRELRREMSKIVAQQLIKQLNTDEQSLQSGN